MNIKEIAKAINAIIPDFIRDDGLVRERITIGDMEVFFEIDQHKYDGGEIHIRNVLKNGACVYDRTEAYWSSFDKERSNSVNSVCETIAHSLGLNFSQVTPNGHLVNDLKIDSTDMARVILALEYRYGIKISGNQKKYFQDGTPKSIADYIRMLQIANL